MGSINTIWKPEYWKICMQGKSQIIADDVIYKMIIGECEDYQCYEIIEFISKDNYDNITSGLYSIKCFPYAELPVLLFDDKQNVIPLVRGTEVIFEKLSRDQKKYISDRKQKILKKCNI